MKDEELESIITKVSDLSHGEIDPSDSQIRNLLSGNLEGPFHFVNLLAVKDLADYPANHELARRG